MQKWYKAFEFDTFYMEYFELLSNVCCVVLAPLKELKAYRTNEIVIELNGLSSETSTDEAENFLLQIIY